MADRMPPLILAAALVTLLSDALEEDETRHLATDGFRGDLRGLRSRIEDELETVAAEKRLSLVEPVDYPIVADD